MFMILEQLKIAEQIVQIAFAATMGALALGLALAFGLGGRPIAQQMLQSAYEAGLRNKEQVKQDVATGRSRAESQAAQAQAQVQSGGQQPSGYPAQAQGAGGYSSGATSY
ncbi:MAG: hypothetical protein WKF73_15235 [Nocardioidaceae bacterium]